MKLKKLLASILCVAMVLSTMGTAVFAEDTVSEWDGSSVDTSWYDADPTEESYIITTAAQFAGLAQICNTVASNSGVSPFKGQTVKLGADINLNGHNFSPIGDASGDHRYFYGSFDGQGHTISNVKIEGSSAKYVGLFGKTGSSSNSQTFENVKLENVTISASGASFVGGLIGRADNAVVKNVDVTGEIAISGYSFVGGVIGHSYAAISNCNVNASGTISGSNWQVGGVVGSHYAAEGASISNCSVNGNNENGGLSIYAYNGAVAGVVGKVNAVDGVESTTLEGLSVSNTAVSATNDYGVGYVTSGAFTSTNSSVTSVTVKLNNNVVVPNDAEKVAVNVAKIGDTCYTDLHEAMVACKAKETVLLVADVDLTGTEWEPVSFMGTFDGQNHTISNLTINKPGISNTGFIASLNGTFKNVTFTNPTVTGGECTGVVAGRAGGSGALAENITVNGVIKVETTHEGYARAGVIVGGWAYGKYINITVDGTSAENSYIKHTGGGDGRYVAGIVGHADDVKEYTNCTVKNITISGGWLCGGIAGPGPGSSTASGCNVEGVKMNADYSGGMFGWFHGETGTIEKCTIKDVEFTDGAAGNGAIGGYGMNPNIVVKDITIENVVNYGGESLITYKASINGTYYETLEAALDKAEKNDVIVVAPGTYNVDGSLKITKNVTITGNPNYGVSTFSTRAAIEKPVFNITEVADGGVKYQAENVTFDNVVFNVAENATRRGGNYACALGYYVEDNKTRNTLTLTDCDFINNSSIPGMIAIMAHIPNYTVKDCTFENFAIGIYTALDNSALGTVNVSDNTFANVKELYTGYWGKDNANASIVIDNNKATDDSTTVIGVCDYAKETIGATATAFGTVTITDNDATVILTNYDINDFTSTVENNKKVIYTYKSKALLDAVDAPEGIVYVSYGRNDEANYIVVDGGVYETAETISVTFEPASEAEGEKIYNINLKANETGVINRLNSADLTFLFTQVEDVNEYEIIASEADIAINPVDNSKVRYEFHFNGKDNVADTATSITIGQVKFTGYGKFSFAVDATVDTNAAHATTVFDNIVDTFIPNGNVANGEGILDVSDNTINGIEITVPTRKLTIDIAFPNAVENNAKAYQDMTVTIVGGTVNKTIALGTDATAYNFSEDLPYNTAYTVTVSGAGYRTARYTVSLTEDKELNFWNNVKDEAQVVEIGKDSSKTKVTFLAGDIVKDNKINIYDLSAVVSYFGTENLSATNHPEYAKYDLNRDGLIDSKDIAYVLVSWGN